VIRSGDEDEAMVVYWAIEARGWNSSLIDWSLSQYTDSVFKFWRPAIGIWNGLDEVSEDITTSTFIALIRVKQKKTYNNCAVV